MYKISSWLFPFKVEPALNISNAYFSISMSAILASSKPICLSFAVVVGEANNRVSEINPESIKPAICLGISILFSLYNI